MTYYRVKKQYDNVMKKRWTGKGFVFDGYYIQNELYTQRELEKLGLSNAAQLENGPFEKVNVNKNRTYWCFGARFEFDKGYND